MSFVDDPDPVGKSFDFIDIMRRNKNRPLSVARYLQNTIDKFLTDEGIKIPTVTEFAPKTGSDNTITALVVNLIESSCKSLQGKYASFGADVVRRVKLGGMVDSVKGLELDFEIAAAELGQLICS